MLLEPAAALPLGCCAVLELVEPPAAPSFFSGSVEGALGGVVVVPAALEELDWSFFDISTEAEPEAEPDGAAGAVLEPADEDEEPAGGVVRDTARSPPLSQPVSNPAPSARDTTTAKVESLMCLPPWLGYD